ncbi:P2Y purinoceptor 3-like [Phyllopteryx taeniolatus]|uniref:P2Y purinoceptor 3-like n=1 Tax=Phyllopteryx taeniolatus TaxID=161469 RepID=UPI002AD50F5F|nr:P2Y purinoceptor 3-like [Phyllopteryx taeniolatus]XP_061606731.1 P2Y purinoceptor 3-like [Phyllopteryx taeniolatus]
MGWSPTSNETTPAVAAGTPQTPPSCSVDESYKYVFLPVCYSLTFVFSLALNSVVLLRSCRGRRRAARNASVIYMVNLAATDLMYGLSLPFLVASYVLRDRWMFGDFMCRLVRFLFYFNIYASIFFLTCISLHREFARSWQKTPPVALNWAMDGEYLSSPNLLPRKHVFEMWEEYLRKS